MTYEVIQGNNIDVLKTFPDNHFDSIVTDPPYGIDFLGKSWDANTGALETYQECLRVLKPGGHILAFSAARTYHHLAVTLEQAGFEIRDQIMWIYSSGFPKSQDIGRSIQRSLGVKEKTTVKGGARPSDKQTGGRAKDKIEAKQEYSTPVLTDPEAKQWEGWGTALKPAHEPICLARKPIKLSIAKNAQRWGTGALNIDATRIERDEEEARFPSNVIGDIPDYQKYFYCPKVSRRERHIGFIDTITQRKMLEEMGGYMLDPDKGGKDIFVPGIGVCYSHGLSKIYQDWCLTNNKGTDNKGNNHPTVKPIELMKYLIKLITPPGGTVLDPFNGSGSTGCAAVELGFEYIGCELDPAYVEISLKRIAAWNKDTLKFQELFE